MYFATRHGDRIAADVGIDPRTIELDMTGVKASFGVDAETEGLTYRELQERRATIRRNLADRRRGRRCASDRVLSPEAVATATSSGDETSCPALASAAMRLVIARCTVDYAGRLVAHLPLAARLIMVKADGCVADPRRRRRLQAAQLDERAEHGVRVDRRRGPGGLDRANGQGRDA